MAVNDTLANVLAAIKNGQQAKLATISSPTSKFVESVLEVLKKEGYIADFSKDKDEKGHARVKIELKYVDGQPAIKTIKKVSKPGRRVYQKISKLPKYYNGLGIAVVSTSKGVMSDYDARIAKLGGEILCNIF